MIDNNRAPDKAAARFRWGQAHAGKLAQRVAAWLLAAGVMSASSAMAAPPGEAVSNPAASSAAALAPGEAPAAPPAAAMATGAATAPEPTLRLEHLSALAADASPQRARAARGTPVTTMSVAGGGWWRLHIDHPGGGPVVLAFADTFDATVTLYPEGAAPRRAMRHDPALRQPGSRHRLAFELAPQEWRAPILVHASAGRSVPVRLSVATPQAYAEADRRWLRVATLVHGGLFVIALTAIINAVALRAWPLLLFAGWSIAMACYLMAMSGEIEALPGAEVLLPLSLRLAYLSAQVGVALAFPFFVWFLGLRDKMRRSARFVDACTAVIGLMALATLAMASLPSWIAMSSNVALMTGQLVLVAAAAFQAWRGMRNARFLLVAWLPTIAATQVLAAAYGGWIPVFDGLEYVYPFAVLFAALVLKLLLAASSRSVADAHRSLVSRVDRDPLTGLPNRAAMTRVGTTMLEQARERGVPMALLFLDVDRFKPINDTWGHAFGDAVLRAFADAVRSQLRGGDVLARYGGEEFVLLLPSTAPAAAERLAERIRARVQSQCGEVEGQRIDLTVSIGLATSGSVPGSIDALLHAADQEVYRAKHEGRNRVCVHRPDLLPSTI